MPKQRSAENTRANGGRPGQTACPYLGRAGDPDTFYIQAHEGHRCYATEPASAIPLGHQSAYCFGDCRSCERYLPLVDGRRHEPTRVAPESTQATTRRQRAAGQSTHTASPSALAPVLAYARNLSFEEWAVYSVTAALLLAIGYFGILADPAGGAPASSNEPGIQQRAQALAATDTPIPTAPPTLTPRPTRPPEIAPRQTAPVPTPPEGGLGAALSPSERAVGFFNEQNRIPTYGERNLHVGQFDGEQHLGGLLFLLNRIPEDARVSYVALELTGLSDENLTGPGTWTVELLDPEVAEEWSDLTYTTFDQAPATQMSSAWQIGSDDLAPRRINVLEFSDDARDLFMQRLEQGEIAFRIRGPEGDEDNLFTWDTGYGEGFGTRPVLRVVFVPPTPTPGPTPVPPGGKAQPTELPLIVWVSDPTPAPPTPEPTALPMDQYGQLTGMILFVSDRFGENRLMVYDPATDRVGQVTQSWPYEVARERDQQQDDTQVSVAGRPCGGEAIENDAGAIILNPDNPKRTCTQVLVHDEHTQHPREVTQTGTTHYDPALSPDGQWIAYVSQRTGNDEIFKIRVDGSDNTRLTDNVWEWDKHPSWSPDSKRIVFWSNREGHGQLYIMNADGSAVENISRNTYNDFNPVWVK